MIKISERFKNYKRQFEIAQQKRQAKKVEIYNKRNGPYATNDPMIICGQPRGGTTWLAEVMADKKTGLIWEPLHPKLMEKFKHTKKLGNDLGNFPYLPEDQDDKRLVEFFNKILKVEFLPYDYISWPKKVNRNLMNKEQWIVKFCRANRLLPWMVKNLDCRPPIYLLRHPCAVVSSQLRHNAFDQMGSLYKRENGVYNDLFLKYEDLLKSVKSPVGKLAAWWAMDNILPLTHPENNKQWITVTYEELISESESSFQHLYERLGLSMPDDLFSKINKPSSTTKPGAQVLQGGNQLEGWRNKLTSSQIEEILDIVHGFGIELYNEELEPDYSKIPK